MWWWDGQAWQPAVSPDGRMRWDGLQWRPIPGQPASPLSVDKRPAGRASPRWLARSIKIAASTAAIIALVAIGSLLIGHLLAPQVVSGPGYTFRVPQGWSSFSQSDVPYPCGVAEPFERGKGKAIDIAQRPILPDESWIPDSIICGPHQEGAKDYYGIYVYTGLWLDQLSFKPPSPWATPGYDAKIPFAFPGATRGEEAECSSRGTFPMWCWRVPGGQKSDSVDRKPPLCGPETAPLDQLGPNNGVWFQQIGRFISVSHGSRDYLIVLSGYDIPVGGISELHCSGFHQLLQSWKWQD
jgi:hypothetical protein